MDLNKLSLEEKVDLLLKYKLSERRWKIVKMIIWALLFIIFIVIPIIWLYQLYSSIDFSGVTAAYEKTKGVSDGVTGGLDKINELLNQL